MERVKWTALGKKVQKLAKEKQEQGNLAEEEGWKKGWTPAKHVEDFRPCSGQKQDVRRGLKKGDLD